MDKILIVDDEESIRFSFKMTLADEGYDVMGAGDYNSALQLISKAEPDLIITDIFLGRLTGIDFLKEIRKRELVCPVIMMTGIPDIKTSREAVQFGAFDYIPKPINRETLLRIVSHGLRHKELLDNKHRLERENLRVRKNMEAIFRSLNDGVITVDNDLCVVEANDAVKEICGRTAGEIIGNRFKGCGSSCGGACVNALKKILKTRKAMDEIQVECRRPGKPGQVVRLTGSPLRIDENKVSGAVLVIRNVTQLATLERELEERQQFHRIIGKGRRMQEIFGLLENISDTDSTALITGETGTGKELIAHAIHHNSPRKNRPFIKVNCSALSENLLESELFGHVRGAFTGAVKDKKGRFEMADRGTIFLDEIGDISPLIQLKLLRVLQEREFERVGDASTIKVDVRVIAATHRNLKEMTRLGEFREDLYYRIKVVDIPIPPLRERREDIPILVDHFSAMFNKRFHKTIDGVSNEFMNALMNYSWPGNIRELEHAVEHGFVLCQEKIILYDHLPVEIRNYFKEEKPGRPGIQDMGREDIVRALARTGWNKSKAARLLGMGRRTIYRKIEEFKITPPEGSKNL
ncbi:sigma-54 dependent transcriptional regulator [Desulfospira joergensenii]|uniref:sigma-54 dependent transcriptional regulator n=1 Tax=Desulfospira joergensenii TaxID=53329 RepID=UPI0003B3DCDF|nr:sigma-54-dependent Fis family transcriptional regulator [Desulfospira joergensenii]